MNVDFGMFESRGEFAKEYIDCAIAAIHDLDSKRAIECLQWAIEKITEMKTQIEPVGN